jgi:hypothetical protein
MSTEDQSPVNNAPSDAKAGPNDVTADEFLSLLTGGKPSEQTLAKINAALADPESNIHAYITAVENFSRRQHDPDHIDWGSVLYRDQLKPRRGFPDKSGGSFGRG